MSYPIRALSKLIAVNTSSRTNCGYSANNSSTVDPAARKSSTNETQIRVPRIHGFPKQTDGSTAMRASNGFIHPDASNFSRSPAVPYAITCALQFGQYRNAGLTPPPQDAHRIMPLPGTCTLVSDVAANTNITTQPIIVQPRNRLRKNTIPVLRLLRTKATKVGKK